MRRLLTLTVVMVVGGCAAVTASQDARAAAPAVAKVVRSKSLTVEDVVDMQSVRDVAISPDGKRIAYVLRSPRVPADEPGSARSVIWMLDTKAGNARQYTADDVSSYAPAWSPDGRWLAFRSNRTKDDHTQVYRISPEGGEPQRVTRHPTSVRAFAWTPDAKSLVYTADRAENEREKKDREAGRDWELGDVHGTFHRLWRVEIDDGQSKALTPREVHIESFRISPTGESIAVVANDRADVDAVMMYSRLATVPAAGGPLKAVAKTEGKLGDFVFSPDGEQIAYLGATSLHDPTAGVLWRVAAAGGQPQALTKDAAATGKWVRWPRKDALVVLANEGVGTTVSVVAPKDGKRRGVQGGDVVCHSADLSADGRTFVCAGDTAEHPAEVFAGPLRGKLKRRTVSNPDLQAKNLGEQSVERWKAEDGLEIEGVVIKPVDYEPDKRYPLAVLVHGGPEGISLNGWETRAGYPAQLFAARGYVVLMPNYRGSQGRGVDYGMADHKDLGGKEFQDVLGGIDHLVEAGLVDGNRVGMGGWSYGGYFSGLAATKHSARFKAAMVGAAITNWISFSGTTEIEHENSLVHWNLWPWDDVELAWARSPMAHAKGSKTATLIVHGASDTRVPPGQAMELYRALRHHGVAAQLVMYPREGHGLGERAHQIDFANRFLDWFDQHVKGT